jgi:hypothetical protein
MVLQDVKYAIRLARRAPVFTVIAVFTLAVGIGANTAVLNLAHALLLRSLPVPEPQNLIRYRLTADGPIPGLDLPRPSFAISDCRDRCSMCSVQLSPAP